MVFIYMIKFSIFYNFDQTSNRLSENYILSWIYAEYTCVLEMDIHLPAHQNHLFAALPVLPRPSNQTEV